MEITIKLTGKQMNEVMDVAEALACKDWFEDDVKAYEEWAGDIGRDIIFNFLDQLYMKHSIKITAEGWED